MASSKKIESTSKKIEEKKIESILKSKITYSKPTLSKWGKVIDTKATVGSNTGGGTT